MKHLRQDQRFARPGDSGSIYYALRPYNEADIDNSSITIEFKGFSLVPIVIHRTSDDEYSYGSPLFHLLHALLNGKKVFEANHFTVEILHYALSVDTSEDIK